MKQELIIKVKDFYSDAVHFRESASEMFDLIREKIPENVELDFQDISFISRSFADQFYKEKTQLLKLNIFINISNANSDIEKMLNIVAKSQSSPVSHSGVFRVRRFSDIHSLSEYLISF